MLARFGIVVGVALFTAGSLRAADPPRASTYPVDPASVERQGSGWRRPQAGWIVLHIEGKPHDRGYQHGRLLATEIAGFIHDLSIHRSSKAPDDAWRDLRLIADALFLRKFDPELLEEMKGIADGAAAGGATVGGRAVDLLDIVTLNADIETTFLDEALESTPHGLEGRRFDEPAERPVRPPAETHCSAFAATGPATADGRIVIGHITMWNLFHAVHYNVWLDVKPSRGHRVMMQTYPGGIMSGLDYYMNDAGIVVCETTLVQTRYHAAGVPLADRIRRALQYGDSIDQVVAILKEGNNGLYTNEWLLADSKTNEIAMFELGTHKSRLWRSSKNEWFGGTKGFYWGCNNAKEQAVRLETVASLENQPMNAVFHPSDRDRKWLELFDRSAGRIGDDFGFRAFTTPPLAASHSLDAKFTTAAMADKMETWAKFGPPLGKAWTPTDAERLRFPTMSPLVGEDWTILRIDAPAPAREGAQPAVDLARKASAPPPAAVRAAQPAWRGTILPAEPADTWLAAAFADYEPVVAAEKTGLAKATASAIRDKVELLLFEPMSRYLTAVARRGGKDIPLLETRFDLRSDDWYHIASGKGVLILAELRGLMGGKRFDAFMDAFGREHAGKPVASEPFFAAAEKALGRSLSEQKSVWTSDQPLAKLPRFAQARRAAGRIWAVGSFERELDQSLIIHGTLAESDAQREAATALQEKLAARWANIRVPIKADIDVKDDELKRVHVLLIGRPSTNALAARWAKALPIAFGPASFTVGGQTYADANTWVVAAGPNPLARDRSVVILAGLSAPATWRCPRALPDRGGLSAEVLIQEAGGSPKPLLAPVADREPQALSADNESRATGGAQP